MSSLDYNRIGQLRIEKDRLQARLDLMEVVGDAMAGLAASLGHAGHALHTEWIEAKEWDGAPANDRASTHRYFKGTP